ncbi:MAG: malonate-semialdehyde dehydrogenase (acetylating) / methylmalonate-semialdehyde dehydrogenase [Frankiales bacterium]|nr:malonate-semialdehyde dehydrogenase (acetylating) / methylmalonate-semialdehyde dehydrogenase [Frankiales bacterium]
MNLVTHWVDGAPWAGTSDRRLTLVNPATGQAQAEVALASAADVDTVVASAKAAFGAWGQVSMAKRTAVLFAFRELLAANRDAAAAIVTREHGKTLDDARGEIDRGLEVVELACGLGQLLKGDYSEGVSTGIDTHSVRAPLGVVAGITPFNFPLMVPLWMHPLAIACGNAFVLKPSEKDPSASLFLADLWSRAGLPAGVFSVLQGDREAVDALLTHPDVRAVSFVGSTPIARHVYETAATHGKRVQALGGAKNHMVVLPDADLDAAADAAVSAGFGSAGQRCMAVSVVVAVGGVADELVERIRARAVGLKVGPGDVAGSDMGPLITREHRDRVASYLDAAMADGADVVLDGRGAGVDGHPEGNWLGPCLVDQVKAGMSVYDDEVFGPVLSVVRVGTLDEALDLVNAGPYGNGTAVFTADGAAARRYSSEVEVGMVGINVSIPVPVAAYPFGGWKDSLFGDTHVYGTDGVRFYTRGRVVTSRWGTPKVGHDLNFPRNA